MWFKYLFLYEFEDKQRFHPKNLSDQLSTKRFKAINQLAPNTQGWMQPINEEENLYIHAAQDFLLLRLHSTDKILPMTVVREQVAERVKELEAKEDRKIYRKEKMSLQDDIYHSLLSQAFSKSSDIYAYIDPKLNLLIINTAAPAKAEIFVKFLRSTLGSFPVHLLNTIDLNKQMTAWLMEDELPPHMTLGHHLVLSEPVKYGRVVRFEQHDLTAPEVQNFIKEGLQVKQMQLQFEDQCSFILNDDFTFRGIKYLENLKLESEAVHAENDIQRKDADFVIMANTVRALLETLMPEVVKQEDTDAVTLADEVA